MSFKVLAEIYEELRSRIAAERDEQFPVGSVVQSLLSDGPQFGIVSTPGDSLPPYMIAIEFENGNIWSKPANEWEVVTNRDVWPDFVWRRRRQSKR